jgi:outer membrane protein TolC
MLIFFHAHWFRTSSTPSLPAITRKTRKGFAALALAAAVALPQTGFTQSALTLAEAQRIAVERSRQLAAQDASITAAREMAVAAGQLPDPVLRLGIDNLPVDGADRFSVERDFMTMRRIGVMQEFTRDGKRKLRTARGEREADRAVAEKTVTLTNIQRDTALAWLERFYLERTRAVVAAQAEEARLEIEAAEGAYRAGRGSQADIYTARAARVALEDRLSELDRRIRNARVMLARWVGDAADAPLAGEPAVKTLMFETHTLDQALERHPEIALLGRQVAVAESEVQLARANKRSDWSVELAYQERGPAFSNMISVGISIPLQWDQKNRQDRELGAKLALAERAKALREDILRAHTAEVRTMLNEWENGHERLARYASELIPLAKDRTQAALAAYRGGKADLNAVLAARRNEIEVRTQTVQLEMETARLWAQLNFLVPDGAHESHSGAAAAAREEK